MKNEERKLLEYLVNYGLTYLTLLLILIFARIFGGFAIFFSLKTKFKINFS